MSLQHDLKSTLVYGDEDPQSPENRQNKAQKKRRRSAKASADEEDEDFAWQPEEGRASSVSSEAEPGFMMSDPATITPEEFRELSRAQKRQRLAPPAFEQLLPLSPPPEGPSRPTGPPPSPRMTTSQKGSSAAAKSVVRSEPPPEPAFARVPPEQLRRWQSQKEKLDKITNRVIRLGNKDLSFLFSEAESSAVVEHREVLREHADLFCD